MLPNEYQLLGKQLISIVFCASNVKFWREGGYFETNSDEKPLLHTWSLSVEEQFYCVIPIILFLLFRFRREKFTLPLIILTCVGSFVTSIYLSETRPSANFYLLPSRAWELGVGSLLSFVSPIKSSKLREISSFVGLTLIIGCYLLFPDNVPFPGASALPPVLGAAFIIWSGIGQTTLPLICRFLTLKLLIGIGLISYSLYLWHWPIFAYQNHLGYSNESQIVQCILLLISFALAWLSWKYIELPFRKKVFFKNNELILIFGICSALSGLLIGATLWISSGNLNRFSKNELNDCLEAQKRSVTKTVNLKKVRTLLPSIVGHQEKPIIFVWGDSHAMHFIPVIEEHARTYNQTLYTTCYHSTAPVLDYYKKTKYGLNENAPEWNLEVLEKIISLSKESKSCILVIASAWKSHMEDEYFIESFQKTLTRISKSTIKKIIIMGQVPHFGRKNNIDGIPSKYIKGLDLRIRNNLHYEQPYSINKSIENDFTAMKGILCDLNLDTGRFYLFNSARHLPHKEDKFFPFINKGGILLPLYNDYHHLNYIGSRYLSRPISSILINE
jgi:peptidoglycan/LPS O-acetylase OafA/YrhL